MTAVTDLMPAECLAAATAVREWLATYSQGARPGDYEAAESALAKIEKGTDYGQRVG